MLHGRESHGSYTLCGKYCGAVKSIVDVMVMVDDTVDVEVVVLGRFGLRTSLMLSRKSLTL